MYKNIALHFNYKSNHIYFEKYIDYYLQFNFNLIYIHINSNIIDTSIFYLQKILNILNINYGYCKTEIILVLNHKIIYDSYRKYKNKNHVDKSCLNNIFKDIDLIFKISSDNLLLVNNKLKNIQNLNYNIDNNIYILQSIVIDNYILYDTYDIEELCNYNLKLYINNGEVSISNYILNKNLYILNYDNIILNKLNIFNLNKFYNIAISNILLVDIKYNDIFNLFFNLFSNIHDISEKDKFLNIFINENEKNIEEKNIEKEKIIEKIAKPEEKNIEEKNIENNINSNNNKINSYILDKYTEKYTNKMKCININLYEYINCLTSLSNFNINKENLIYEYIKFFIIKIKNKQEELNNSSILDKHYIKELSTIILNTLNIYYIKNNIKNNNHKLIIYKNNFKMKCYFNIYKNNIKFKLYNNSLNILLSYKIKYNKLYCEYKKKIEYLKITNVNKINKIFNNIKYENKNYVNKLYSKHMFHLRNYYDEYVIMYEKLLYNIHEKEEKNIEKEKEKDIIEEKNIEKDRIDTIDMIEEKNKVDIIKKDNMVDIIKEDNIVDIINIYKYKNIYKMNKNIDINILKNIINIYNNKINMLIDTKDNNKFINDNYSKNKILYLYYKKLETIII